MSEQKSAAELAVEIKGDLERRHNEVKAIADDAIGRAKAGEDMTRAAKEVADQALTALNETKARLDELEQKAARQGAREDGPTSPGAEFVASDEYKSRLGEGANLRPGQVIGIDVKAITSLTTDAAGSAGAATRYERVASPLVNLPDQTLSIRSLVAPGQIAGPGLEYYQETGFTNGAGMVAEGALKPESSIKLGLKNAPVRKIAHWMIASAEILADAPAVRSMIDNRLRYGLRYVEDVQLLKGDGTGNNLLGIKPQASDYAVPTGFTAPAGATKIDKLRIAQLQVALALYPADGQVLHPIDWAEIELTKDGEGRYIIGNPQGTIAPTLWGLPVVATTAQTVGEFTVGAFRLAAQVFDRMQSQVLVSTEDGDNFRRNMVTILAEERLAFTVYRPEAFVDGPFTPAG